jgi:ABC-type proline/glycine betaine transport system permease subunit
MTEPPRFEKKMRAALVLALAMVVVIAPLIGVYGLAPFVFAYRLEPYELAVAISVMFAEAVAIATIAFLVMRSRK